MGAAPSDEISHPAAGPGFQDHPTMAIRRGRLNAVEGATTWKDPQLLSMEDATDSGVAFLIIDPRTERACLSGSRTPLR